MSAKGQPHRISILAGLLALSLFLSPAAFADCINPTRAEGAIIYNEAQNVPQVCAGDAWFALGAINPAAGGGSCTSPARTEGAIVYNIDNNVLQYCDGTNWIGLHGGPGGGFCAAPSDCSNIGDVCADGSQFAGFKIDGSSCYVIYVTDDNQSLASQWKNATGTDDIATDSFVDGSINKSQVSPIASFGAFNDCEVLNRHSHTDWYLPARDELNLLWENKAAIDANATGNFTTSDYWSSTEFNTTNARNLPFSNGRENLPTKTSLYDVRCIRSELSSGAPIVCTAPSGCTNIGDVCADGSLFAGFLLYGTSCEAVFATDINQSTAIQWKTSSGINDIATDSWEDGQINQAQIEAQTLSDFPAFELCSTLSRHSHTDWYLPAKDEMALLYKNRTALSLIAAHYWTSTEFILASFAWVLNFGDGNFKTSIQKNLNHDVRCVRRN